MKKTIMPIALVFVLALAVFVYAAENSRSVTSVHLEKGWNLIQGVAPPERIKAGDISKDNIKAITQFLSSLSLMYFCLSESISAILCELCKVFKNFMKVNYGSSELIKT